MRSIGIEVLAHSYQPTFLRDLTGLSSPLVVIEESLELFGGSVMLWAAYHRAGLTFNISATESYWPRYLLFTLAALIPLQLAIGFLFGNTNNLASITNFNRQSRCARRICRCHERQWRYRTIEDGSYRH